MIDLRLGDNVTELRTMPDECIDLTVTSPPYDNLRNYGGHTWDFENVARELYRVTKRGGVVVWVVGDATIKGSETGTSFRQALFFMDCGFNLHDTMIYQKSNAQNPSHTRYEQLFEFMFIFGKGTPKTFNPIKDKKNRWAGTTSFGQRSRRGTDGNMQQLVTRPVVQPFGKRGNVWHMKTAAQENICKANDHPATFPEALARDHILSWSNEGDTVLDPFAGSGTTLKMAAILKRNAIGIEIHAPYVEIARQRIAKAQAQLPLNAVTA